MATSHLYDDFGGRKQKPAQSEKQDLSASEIEDLKLAAFEQGFAAGWDDAVKAHTDGKTQQNDAIVESLKDSSFTLLEARRGLIDALAPLFAEISAKLLPSMARAGLALHVAEQLKQMTAASLDQPIELHIAKSAVLDLEELLAETDLPDLSVVELDDDGFPTARLAVGCQERDIDMARLVAEIEEAMSIALLSMKQEMPNG